MNDLRDLFAVNVRRLRHGRGLSRDELADAAGMSRGYLAQLETGKYHVSLKIIAKFAQALRAEPAGFLRRESRRDRPKWCSRGTSHIRS
jgi:transcriptional regulator with XRE-family HTH domain